MPSRAHKQGWCLVLRAGQFEKEKPTQDAASGAAAPDVMVVIQGLLFASSHTCVMRSPFFFQHVGDHLAISPSHLVEDNLRISCLLEFLYLSCEVLSVLL